MNHNDFSYATSAKTMYSALSILSENGGSMHVKDLMNKVQEAVEFTDWEKLIIDDKGTIRWRTCMQYTSVDYVKAGYIIKEKGIWTVTPQGVESLKLGIEGSRDKAHELYLDWKARKRKLKQ